MKARILLVEDDADLARGLSFNLRHEGYEVLLAGTVKDGKRMAARDGADLVVLDLMLPDGDGLEVLRSIREGAAAPRSSASPPGARRPTRSWASAPVRTTT